MTDVAVLSETQRQGEATRAALGVQMRARPLWSGAGRFSGVPVRFINPYRMRGLNSPDYLFETIVHNGAVYMADGQIGSGVAAAYTSTDLKTWVTRTIASSHTLTAGKLMAAGSLLFAMTAYAGNGYLYNSMDNGVTWDYRGTAPIGAPACSAGGIVYVFSTAGTTSFQTMSAANPVAVNRNFANARSWRKVVYNGSRWLAIDNSFAAAEWSANGLDGWASVAGFPSAMEAMPNGTRSAYAIGGRFLVFTVAAGAVSLAYSDNATTWAVGIMGETEPNGMRISALSESAAEMGGVLYIPAKLTDGTSSFSALLATDGTKIKWLPPFWRGAEALPSICAKAGGGGLIFNAASTGVTGAHRYENNPDAMEVYLAV